MITQSDDIEPDVASQAQGILVKVYKVLADDANVNLSLNQVLIKAEVSLNDYMKALEVSSRGSVVVLNRKPSECCIYNYNTPVMLAWQTNFSMF